MVHHSETYRGCGHYIAVLSFFPPRCRHRWRPVLTKPSDYWGCHLLTNRTTLRIFGIVDGCSFCRYRNTLITGPGIFT